MVLSKLACEAGVGGEGLLLCASVVLLAKVVSEPGVLAQRF